MRNQLMKNIHSSLVEKESNLGGSFVMVFVSEEREQRSQNSELWVSMEDSMMSLVVVEHPYEERENQESENNFKNLYLSQEPFLVPNS